MNAIDVNRFITALLDGELDCSFCKYWKTHVANQVWGNCLAAKYCEDEGANESPMVMSYTYCAAEKEGEPPLDHKIVMDTARGEFFCKFWERK